MTPALRFGLMSLGLGLFLGSVYFSLKNQDLGLLSASVVSLKTPAEEIDLSASRDSKLLAISPPAQIVSKQLPTCQSGKSATSSIYLNEIAWMGSGSDTKAEWIELKNFSSKLVNLSGWQLLDKTQNIKLALSGAIEGDGFRVFRRSSDFTGTINNSDEVLSLFNARCELVDEIKATPSWPAGKTDGRTAERGNGLTWHTSAEIGGTPNAGNSVPVINPVSSQSTLPTSSTSTSTVTSSASFGGPPPILGGGQPIQVLISEVMVGNDTSGSYEFIELYNAGSGSVDLSGWSIKKLSSTGKEYSFVSKDRFKDLNLLPRQYLLLANEKGYTGAPTPDILCPGSYSLAYKENGINFYDADGKLIDELYWPEIPKNQSYNRTSWDSANFKLSSPTPQNSQN